MPSSLYGSGLSSAEGSTVFDEPQRWGQQRQQHPQKQWQQQQHHEHQQAHLFERQGDHARPLLPASVTSSQRLRQQLLSLGGTSGCGGGNSSFAGGRCCSSASASTVAEDLPPWAGSTHSGKPSQHLQRLLDSVASSEAWLEMAQEHNYRLRVRCLHQMRGSSLLSTMRGPFTEWASLCARCRIESQFEEERSVFLERLEPLVMRLAGGGGGSSCSRSAGFGGRVLPSERSAGLHSCFRGWRLVLWSIRQENLMLDELQAHREGRGQLIQEYRDLQAELEAERRLSEELRAKNQESSASAERLREEVAWIASRLERQTREAEEHASRERALAEELRDSREHGAGLKREQRIHVEQLRRLEAQVQQGDEERKDLHEDLIRAERSAEQARSDLRLARDAELGHCQAALRRSEGQVVDLEAQLEEARAYMDSFSRGASAFLNRDHRGNGGGSGPPSTGNRNSGSGCGSGPSPTELRRPPPPPPLLSVSACSAGTASACRLLVRARPMSCS